MTNDVSWSLSRVGVAGVSSSVIEFEIRQIGYTEISAKNEIGINAVIASPVSLPSAIDIAIDALTNISQARIDFLSNGEFRGSDGDLGSYTTVVDGVGSLYESRATNLVGVLDLGEANVWVPLSGSGASYSITVESTEVVTFDVEIREIANVANTTTSAVTLSATF